MRVSIVSTLVATSTEGGGKRAGAERSVKTASFIGGAEPTATNANDIARAAKVARTSHYDDFSPRLGLELVGLVLLQWHCPRAAGRRGHHSLTFAISYHSVIRGNVSVAANDIGFDSDMKVKSYSDADKCHGWVFRLLNGGDTEEQ